MSKKTKKEKIIAAYRKKLRLLERSSIESRMTKEKNVIPAKTGIHQTPEVKKTEQETRPVFFFVDFRKSLIFVALIIALEIALYFVKLLK